MPKVTFPEGNVWKEFQLKTSLITPPIIKLELKPSFKKDVTLALLKEIKIKKEQLEELENVEKEEEVSDDIISQALVPYFDTAVNLAMSLVVDWDLTDNEDKKIPCTEEKKKYFLEPLMWESVIPGVSEEDDTAELEVGEEFGDDEEEEEPKKKKRLDYLFLEIAKFSSNMKNFSKN